MNWFTKSKNNKKIETRSTTVEDAAEAITGLSSDKEIKKFDTHEATTLSAAYMCTELISNSIASMPIELKSLKDNGNKVDNNPLKYLFNNGLLSEFNLKKNLIWDCIWYGNGFLYIERKKKMPISLRYIKPNDVSVEYFKEYNKLIYRINGNVINNNDIIHIFKNSDITGHKGVGILHYMYRTANNADYTESASSELYSSGLNVNAILHAKSPLNKALALQALTSFNNAVSSSANKRLRFLPFDLDLQLINITAGDALLIENRQWNIEEITRFFSVPVGLLKDNTNTELLNILFLTNCLTPYIYILELELNRKLIDDDDLYFDMDESVLIRTSLKDSADYYSTLVNNGIMTRKEARERLGLKYLDDTDDLIIPFTKIEDNKLNSDDEDKTEDEDTTVEEEKKDEENVETNEDK